MFSTGCLFSVDSVELQLAKLGSCRSEGRCLRLHHDVVYTSGRRINARIVLNKLMSPTNSDVPLLSDTPRKSEKVN